MMHTNRAISFGSPRLSAKVLPRRELVRGMHVDSVSYGGTAPKSKSTSKASKATVYLLLSSDMIMGTLAAPPTRDATCVEVPFTYGRASARPETFSLTRCLLQITVKDIADKHAKKEPITMLTAYDCTQARLASSAGVDCILVGDSLGMVMMGRQDTVSVTMDEMKHHCRAVAAGSGSPLIVGDLPFGSYTTPEGMHTGTRLPALRMPLRMGCMFLDDQMRHGTQSRSSKKGALMSSSSRQPRCSRKASATPRPHTPDPIPIPNANPNPKSEGWGPRR